MSSIWLRILVASEKYSFPFLSMDTFSNTFEQTSLKVTNENLMNLFAGVS